ncbi:hypothetical protein H4582DRAFT_1808630 [Lactarius indigo]|nr:hypothetical protein H4582DRAFT_1808630 [Lactarius indigo]
MDVDETIWIEEPFIPEQTRVGLHPCPSPIVFYMFSQSQHIYMEEFIPRIGPYLRCLLNSEGVPAMTMCQGCMSAPFEWRCTDCFPALVLCKECCRKSHNRLPFHRVQKWTGKYFMPSWLREVGICLRLGHSGDLCPIQKGNQIITVIDRSGIHEIGVSWCFCPEAPEHDMQLMMAGLFPATFRNPKTAFTFRVLEDFHLDNLECKTTPSQFFSRLRRLTNDEFPNSVPDRYRELLRVSRQWRVLISRKRFGFGYGENEEQKPGSC